MRRLAARPDYPSDQDVFAWLMEMGTGKTYVALDEFGAREEAKDLSDLLVIAPAGSYTNWFRRSDDDPGEMQKHLSEDLYDRLVIAPWVSGKNVTNRRRLEAMLETRDRPRALVVNIEALSSVVAAREAVRQFLEPGRAMMVIDESTVIKTPSAERTQFALEVAPLARARRIMTGLVTPRDPLDLFAQFEFLDWRILGFKSYYGFRARYAITQKIEVGGRKIDIVVGFHHVEELTEKIAPYSYRVLKKDCLDIPPKQYSFREVPMTKEQHRIYNELKSFATSSLGGENYVTATMVITQILRLHQVLCGHVTDENGVTHAVPENRSDQIIQLLHEHGGKAIIWVAYDPSLRALAARLKKTFGDNSVAMFWGGNRSTRTDEESRWKRDPECRFMIATAAAGGRGNQWTQATLVIYHSCTNNLEHRDQSEDRAHRDGQTETVNYVDMVVPNTVEMKIIKSLRSKIDMSTTITGENYREWLV